MSRSHSPRRTLPAALETDSAAAACVAAPSRRGYWPDLWREGIWVTKATACTLSKLQRALPVVVPISSLLLSLPGFSLLLTLPISVLSYHHRMI